MSSTFSPKKKHLKKAQLSLSTTPNCGDISTFTHSWKPVTTTTIIQFKEYNAFIYSYVRSVAKILRSNIPGFLTRG